ncbi:MAG: ATP-binding protein, partial [Tannerellaceae bacterium]|nr:ATP-binding protein [Tannerellaceae bacterium]
MIKREIENVFASKMFSGKAIIVIGARQTGKTTVINKVLETYSNVLLLDGDDSFVRNLLADSNTENIHNIIDNHKIVFIDEAQRIENIGLIAKIIVDKFKDVQLIVSGSSAFEIKNSLSESLTGRKWEYVLYPISWREFEQTEGYVKALKQLELRLVYGMYPEIIMHPAQEKERLKQLVDSYLYRDLLAFAKIKKPEILENLLKALALQIGSEISYTELAGLLGIDKNTVKSYIEVLERGFVIFTLGSFSRNLRNELKFAKKIYFWDNGIRNAIINSFNPPNLRQDTGDLWENFMISERLKRNNFSEPFAKSYFWRTTEQQEIDYIEENGDKISAFEFKWNTQKQAKNIQL